jgi:hypothetical protein
MKKIFALLVSCVMLFSAAAMAETVGTDPTMQVTFDETTATYAGQWINFDDCGFAVYLPEDATEPEITDEQAAQGLVAAFQFAGGTVTIVSAETPADYDIATMINELTAKGMTGIVVADFNGMTVVGADDTANDATVMMWLDGLGYLYAFSALPVSNADFSAVCAQFFASFSPLIEAE